METQKITWEDFQKGLNNLSNPKYSETNIICPNCGKTVYLDTQIVLTTYPVKRCYKCLECGWSGVK